MNPQNPICMENQRLNGRPSRVDIQTIFLSSIKDRLPRHLSLSDEMSELLHISRDSAYRRIRKETILSLDEVRILCERYNVSIDSLMEKSSGRVSFEFEAQYGPGLSIKSWLESVHDCLKMMEAQPDGHIIWHSKELPIFHYFRFPKLAAFKLYWWMNLSNCETYPPAYNERKVGLDLLALGERTWHLYSKLSSTEIVSRDLINTTLRQVEYAQESGLLAPDTAAQLCHECTELVQLLEDQASQGIKREDTKQSGGKLELYLNELMTGDNTLLFQSSDRHFAFVTYNNFNIMSTCNESFCKQTDQYMKAMIRKGVLISKVAERERIKFFKGIHQQIENTRSLLNARAEKA